LAQAPHHHRRSPRGPPPRPAQAGADAAARDARGRTPLALAIERRSWLAVPPLLRAAPGQLRARRLDLTLLLACVIADDVSQEVALSLIALLAAVGYRHPKPPPPPAPGPAAAGEGRGARPAARAKAPRPAAVLPLHVAVLRRRDRVIAALTLHLGADPDTPLPGPRMCPPLKLVAARADPLLAAALLRGGASARAPDARGRTPLAAAMRRRSFEEGEEDGGGAGAAGGGKEGGGSGGGGSGSSGLRGLVRRFKMSRIGCRLQRAVALAVNGGAGFVSWADAARRRAVELEQTRVGIMAAAGVGPAEGEAPGEDAGGEEDEEELDLTGGVDYSKLTLPQLRKAVRQEGDRIAEAFWRARARGGAAAEEGQRRVGGALERGQTRGSWSDRKGPGAVDFYGRRWSDLDRRQEPTLARRDSEL
jgi:hypothetical protein